MGTVLSIGKLARGQANYYLQQARRRLDRSASVASGVEDYYLGGAEASGDWLGALSGTLHLHGAVNERWLHAVLEGRSPVSDEPLSRRARRVPGFDVTFSAPKSVSVLFGIGDMRVRKEVRDAHDIAVRDAFAYLERQAAMTRRGQDGRELVRGDGLIAAAFRHRTSRAGDPQLHTHVLVANITRSADGVWRALDGRRLYAHARTAGFLYEARLRGELTLRLGVAWQQPRNGIADIEGIPRQVLRAFSRRRGEIEAELERVGRATPGAARVAALETRRRKDYDVTPEQLAPEWVARAARLGLDRAAIESRVLRRQPAVAGMSVAEIDELAARLAGENGLTQTRSVIARRDALQAWCEQMPIGRHTTIDEIEEEVDRVLGSQAFVRLLVPGPVEGGVIRRADGGVVSSVPGERLYTTPELLAAEERVIDLATQDAQAPTAVAGAVDRAIGARPRLAHEQAAMVRGITTDPRRVSVVVGKAGTGKTYGLDCARAAWEASGVPVTGAAVARRAARELEEGSGIVSTSVDALLSDLRRGATTAIATRSVVVIDEASLLGTRDLRELLEHVVHADGKLVLVGDDRQLPAIRAGGAFLALARRLGAFELKENRRQVAAWEREALDHLRDGRAPEAIELYAENGRLVVADDAEGVRCALLRDWWRDGDVGDALMIAFRRADVRDLNKRARALRAAAGELGDDPLKLRDCEIAAGDWVVLRRNDRRLDVANGDRGVVVGITPAPGSVDVEVRGRRVRLDRTYLSPGQGRAGLALGYAVTGHVAQGITVDRSLVLGTDTLFREWGYVGMSRGRVDNRFYAVAGTPERDEFAPSERGRVPLDDVAEALARSRAHTLALDAGCRADLMQSTDEQLIGEVQRLRREGAARTEAAIRELRRLRTALTELDDVRPESQLVRERRRALRATSVSLERQLDPKALEGVARVAVLQEELSRRQRLAACGRRLIAPPAMLEGIGPRPERPSELRLWRRRAAAFESTRPRTARQLTR
jgi:conjugative relaxase-like TrwC/TraI family protein